MAEKISVFRSPEGEVKNVAAYDAALMHWPVSFEELDIPTQFGITHIIASGLTEKRPLILLHGQDSCAISWIYNIPALCQIYRTYAVDTPGDMGKSRPTCLPGSRKEYAEWLLELLEGLKIDKADLMGLSYGGFLATNFALAYPQHINRIVLLAPGIPNFGPPTLQWANYGMPMMLLPSRYTVKRFINGISTKGYSREDPVFEQMIIGMMNVRHLSFMRPVFTDEELREITVPILLLVGDHEIMYEPRKALDRAISLIPNIHAELIPDASHMLNKDQPELVIKEVLDFLLDNSIKENNENYKC